MNFSTTKNVFEVGLRDAKIDILKAKDSTLDIRVKVRDTTVCFSIAPDEQTEWITFIRFILRNFRGPNNA